MATQRIYTATVNFLCVVGQAVGLLVFIYSQQSSSGHQMLTLHARLCLAT